MADTVLLPQQGNSVESVILLQWSKQEGDTVAVGDTLCEVETDKTTMEVESTCAGTILKHLVSEGDEVPVKTEIVVIGEPGESIEEWKTKSHATPSEPDTSQEPAQTGPPKPARPAAPPATDAVSSASSPANSESAQNVGVSPRARMRARDKGLDTRGLTGTGPGGRVIERDVQRAAAGPGTGSGLGGRNSATDAGEAAREETDTTTIRDRSAAAPTTEIKVQGIRKVIADRMRASLSETAQLTLHTSADARQLQALRTRFKQEGTGLETEKINLNDMVMFAVARTLPEFPEVNAHFESTVIRRFSAVDLGFAVDTERGLMVPAIRSAHTLSLRDLSREIKALAKRCQDGSASSDDLGGGTFTVTNLGSFGIEYFTPVLNPPQVAILGVNSIQPKAIFDENGGVQHIPHLGLSLTIDHQAVDGAPASRFLQTLCRRIALFDLLLTQ